MTDIIQEGPFKGLRRNHYKVIYADPPWTFNTRSDKGKDKSPEQHYACMTIEDIKSLPMEQIMAKDCIILMWVIDTHIEMSLDVFKAWGVTYKTRAFCWAKMNKLAQEKDLRAGDKAAYFTGMGFWTRANPEDCWLGVVGKPKRVGKGVRRLVVAPKREHSRKPDEVYERIEELADGPYLEMFSRSDREGWDSMGNEVGKFTDSVLEDAIASLI